MNERIVKLFMESVDSNYIPVPIEDHIPSWTEKFAELIVRECIKVCEPVFLDESYEDMSEFGKGLVEGQDVAVEKIKEHFGVEE